MNSLDLVVSNVYQLCYNFVILIKYDKQTFLNFLFTIYDEKKFQTS